MKLKLTKPKNIIYQLLFGLVLVGSSIAVSVSGSHAYAAMSLAQLKEKINSPMRNYCAPVAGQNYAKCTGTYTAGAEAVYIADSEATVNKQESNVCSPPLQNWVPSQSISNCGAFVHGVSTAQSILGKPYYNNGGAKTDNPSNPSKPASTDPTPPISQCNGIKDTAIRKECIKDYRRCDQPPYDPSYMPACKKKAIAAAKKKEADKNKPGGGKPGGGAKPVGGGGAAETPNYMVGTHQCGNLPNADDNFKTKFNFGCLGDKGPAGLGPIQDLAFAIIRFLSVGVGIAITISLIMAGIQYTSAEGNPDSSQKAKLRAQQALIGLAIYIFAFSILQFLIPGGIFKPGSWLMQPDPLLVIFNKLGALL